VTRNGRLAPRAAKRGHNSAILPAPKTIVVGNEKTVTDAPGAGASAAEGAAEGAGMRYTIHRTSPILEGMKELKIGLVGLDTSHVVAFAKCFNKAGDAEHVAGGRITLAYPGGSSDFELSSSRVAKFTAQLRDEFGVKIVDAPDAVAEAVDLLFITAVDGRTHLDYVRKTISARRPTFIDKPLAVNSRDAAEIFRLGEQHDVPVMSCSSLRHAEALEAALADDSLGAIVGADVFGPMNIEPTQGGLYWYGIHSVEILNRVLGAGCSEVKATTTENHDLVTATWPDGRVGSVHGLRGAHHKFGVTIHRAKGFQFIDAAAGRRSWYATMLDAILRSLPHGRSDVDPRDTLEIIRLIEAANESRGNGHAVKL
jgi:predicted dehydrogenase